VTISQLGSYTKAAEKLRIAQPSLSVAIRKLEEELGLALLRRNNKQVVLTEGGKLLLQEAKKVIVAADTLQITMKNYSAKQNSTIQFAFPSNVGYWLWSVLTQDFAKQYPHITIIKENGGTKELLTKLETNQFELVYGVLDYLDTKKFASIPVKKGEMKLLCAKNHLFAGLKAVDIKALATENIIMYPKGTTLAEKLFQAVAMQNKLQLKTVYVDERSIVYDLVSQNLGIGVVLDDTMPLLLNNDKLTSRSFTLPIYFTSGLIWRKNGKLTPGAETLRHFITNYQKLK